MQSITPDGICQRDQIVFEECKKRKVPVVMVTSGGYQKETGVIIADSILNLWRKKLTEWPPASEHVKKNAQSNPKSNHDEL